MLPNQSEEKKLLIQNTNEPNTLPVQQLKLVFPKY